MSLDVASLKTKIPVSTLSKVERRTMPASDNVKKKLTKFFKRPADELLADAPETAA